MLRQLVTQSAATNVSPMCTSMETYQSEFQYDAIFCYSAIYMTDIRAAVANMANNLAPGGKIYFNTNGLGYFLDCIIHRRNDSQDYAVKSIENTIACLSGDVRDARYPVIVSPKMFLAAVRAAGLTVIASGGDGTIDLTRSSPKQFFSGDYAGIPSVFEVLCEKSIERRSNK